MENYTRKTVYTVILSYFLAIYFSVFLYIEINLGKEMLEFIILICFIILFLGNAIRGSRNLASLKRNVGILALSIILLFFVTSIWMLSVSNYNFLAFIVIVALVSEINYRLIVK